MTHFMGFRDCCRQAKSFPSKEARDEWEGPHGCGEPTETDEDEDTTMGGVW